MKNALRIVFVVLMILGLVISYAYFGVGSGVSTGSQTSATTHAANAQPLSK